MQKKDLIPPFPDQVQPQEHYPQPREVPPNLTNTGRELSELPDRKPPKDHPCTPGIIPTHEIIFGL